MKKIKTAPSMPSEVEVEKVGENRVKISAYPFESGYAISVAHPLRRLLLGSTVGFAPIGIKIDGASHEFDSIRGMLEDVAIFIINLKNIRFKIKNSERRAEVSYSFSGPREIFGSDLENESVEVVTPDGFLATLNEDAELNFTLLVHQGIGYVPSEEIREELAEGFIALDAFFTPVRAASYTIEKMLVEDNPNYEKIVFDIKTDGQKAPIAVFQESLDIMKRQMSVFENIANVDISSAEFEGGNEESLLKKLSLDIEAMGLSARSFNSLERAGIQFAGELSLMSENEMKEIKNLGKKSLEEIRDKIEELNIPTGEGLEAVLLEKLKQKIEALKI